VENPMAKKYSMLQLFPAEPVGLLAKSSRPDRLTSADDRLERQPHWSHQNPAGERGGERGSGWWWTTG